jgi:hypothetical protein
VSHRASTRLLVCGLRQTAPTRCRRRLKRFARCQRTRRGDAIACSERKLLRDHLPIRCPPEEGCKLYYELTDARTRPIDVFYCYDTFLDGGAQDRELDREDRSGEVPTAEEKAEKQRLHFENKKKLLGVARDFLTAEKSAWSDCPARDYNIVSDLPVSSLEEAQKAAAARRTKWPREF